jgi:cobalt-zinc-cadmium efflux system outer membrane protein
MAEVQGEYSRELARAFDIEVLANPEFQIEQVYTTMGIQGANDPQTNAALAQKLRLSNFGQRQKVARLLREAGDRERGSKLLELTLNLSLKIQRLYVLQRSKAILLDSEQRASKKVALVHEGVKKGLLSEGEHKLFEAEKYRIQSERKGIESAIQALQAELSKSTGVGCQIIFSDGNSSESLPSKDVLLSKARESRVSQSTRADMLLALASEQVRLAELDQYPEVAPRLVYQHTNDGGDFFGAGITVPLPIFNRNQGELTRAHADEVAVRRKRELLQGSGLETQVRQLHAAAVNAEERSEIFAKKVVPAYEAALASQERLYTQGKGSVLQVWQVFRIFNDARSEALQLSLAAATARIELSVLVGEEI